MPEIALDPQFWGWLAWLEWLLPLGAFVAGLASTPHCALMCGPLLTAHMRGVGPGEPAQAGPTVGCGQQRRGLWYSSGRVAGYTLLGALAGAFGTGLNALSSWLPVQQLASVLSIGVLAGVFITGRDSPGGTETPSLWRRLHARAFRALSFNQAGARGSLATGALSALLPCGALIPVWLLAAGSGSALAAAQLSLAFGLGTLPGAFGWLWLSQSAVLSRLPLRFFAGVAVLVLSVRVLMPVFAAETGGAGPLCTVPVTHSD